MRNPILVLENLAKKSKQEDYTYERLYRNLYNPEFYYLSYKNISTNTGNLTIGGNEKTIDGMSVQRVENLIEKLKTNNYHPVPSRRVYINKKDGKKRPLGILSFEDKLLQEVVRMILEGIYEQTFSIKSHGFRPDKSCHTALKQIKQSFQGVKWFIEGDIKSFFDNIDHHILINILRKRIKDEKFIQLIWKLLRAGYLEDWVQKPTYSGTPQGGIISPILSNIYLNELDMYMKKYKEKFDKGKNRKKSTEYGRKSWKLYRIRKDYKESWQSLNEETKEVARNRVKVLKNEIIDLPYKIAMDENYKRIQYVRYADDFMIGVIGNKKDCQEIKKDITEYLHNNLKIELSQEKTKITHSSERARFLGYDIKISRDNKTTKKTASGYKQRTRNMVCELLMPYEIPRKKLIEYKAMTINTQKREWKPAHRSYLLRNDDLEIINTYNAEIRGLYNYYSLASNVYKLNNFKYIMEYSFYKTLASKYRSSIKKIISKYQINGNFGIRYKTKTGMKICYFYNEGFKKKNEVIRNPKIDMVNTVNNHVIHSRNSLLERLLAEKCEWCEKENIKIEIHHVKKLKDLKGKKSWERKMIERRRKTMALCQECHVKLHNGKLD